MDGVDATRLDTEFDQVLVEMKPHVLRLPHKADRQRCTIWIKKFCEPPGSFTTRKNRNMYAQLMIHMLKKGIIEAPFHEKPPHGTLPAMPSYMSIYFDAIYGNFHKKDVPDWVNCEIGSEISGISSIPLEPSATVEDLFTKAHGKRKEQRTISPSSSRRQSQPSNTDARFAPIRTTMPEDLPGAGKGTFSDEDGISDIQDFTLPKSMGPTSSYDRDDDWRKGFLNTTSFASSRGTNLKDDFSLFSRTGNSSSEVDMKVKMMEAKFQEEKLRLQHRHDTTVQKILDRKNAEIEEMKAHYKTKCKEQESQISRLERKMHEQQKEIAALREAKEQQIDDLRRIAEDAKMSTQNELEKKLHDCVASFEQEKFDLHKQHTKSIQDLLEETNARLQRMETEYNQQTDSTGAVIRELESRLQQLTNEAEMLNRVRGQLEGEKSDLETTLEKSQTENIEFQQRIKSLERDLKLKDEDHRHEMNSTKNKHEAALEFLKQEHHMTSAKSADTIEELEKATSHLKSALEQSEQQRTKALRDIEELHHHDKQHLEALQSKKIRSLQQELEQMEEEYNRKIHKLEEGIREKEVELSDLNSAQQMQVNRADQALTDFKAQVENNTTKMYEDMKQQMGRVEADLRRSKQLREKQTKEYERQLAEQKSQHEKTLAEVKAGYERDKVHLVQQLQLQNEESAISRHKEWESIRLQLHGQLSDMESQAKEREERDAKTIAELEESVQSVRDDLVQANQLRKQQLLELGLLREEEKQKALRDHENQMSKLKSEMEQQRLELEKKCSLEIEQMLEKTNIRLREIETEYSVRNNKANETIIELQKTVQHLKDDICRQRDEACQDHSSVSKRAEEDKLKLKHLHATAVKTLKQEIESHKSNARQLEKKYQQMEMEYDEQLTELRRQFEDRLRGLLPSAARQELEETIYALKSQVSSLQQRATLLQDEVDEAAAHSLRLHQPLATSANTLASTTSSIKSFS